MSKRTFIRAIVIRALPKSDRIDAAIDYAENLWQHLTLRGYGDQTTSEQRANVDYYAQLKEPAKHGFDRFWQAFHRKGDDKQGAARRWGQLAKTGMLTPQTTERIVAAAAAEAALPRGEGEVRVMARRWLFERRWEGYAEGRPKDDSAERAAERRRLIGDLAYMNGLRETQPYEGLEDQIANLQMRIDELGRSGPEAAAENAG